VIPKFNPQIHLW